MSANDILTLEMIEYMGSNKHKVDISYARELSYIIHRIKPWENEND